MRPGLTVGDATEVRIDITSEMTATVAGREMHPAYGTIPFATHVEQVCRHILEPHLEDGEEGVGYRLEIVHRRPVPVGRSVTLRAVVSAVDDERLVCEVTATDTRDEVAAEAVFEQRVVSADAFAARLRDG